MILFCMISFTSSASTPMEKQNKKTTIVSGYSERNQVIVVNVEFQANEIVSQNVSTEVVQDQQKEKVKNIFVPTDVGWCIKERKNTLFFRQKTQ